MVALRYQDENKVRAKAMAWSVAVHTVLLLLFFLMQYSIKSKVPEIENGGFEVNLGTGETGSGDNQPMKKNAPGDYQAAVVYKTEETKSALPDKLVETSDNSAPDIAARNDKNKETVPNRDKTENEAKQQPRYAYQGETGPGGNNATDDKKGTNEGNDNGPGDKGVPGGTAGAPNYSGVPGNGTGGIGHTLTGRNIYPDKFEAEFSESGKVIIHVTVDRNGNIIKKNVISSSSSQLTKLALEKLNNAKFSKSTGVEPEQFGDVTIIFKTHS